MFLSILSPSSVSDRTVGVLLVRPTAREAAADVRGPPGSETGFVLLAPVRHCGRTPVMCRSSPICYQLFDLWYQNGHLTTPRSFPTALGAWFAIKTLLWTLTSIIGQRGASFIVPPVKPLALPFRFISIHVKLAGNEKWAFLL